MRPLEMTASLAAFERRGPGTDAERRAARWLASELRASGRRVSVEPFWCRPNWALAHAWHLALALAGSLISVSHPTLGAVLLALALVSILADGLIGVSLGRRLTPERASQNVVIRSEPPAQQEKPTTLLVTANYDAGRTALLYRDALRRPAASLRRLAGPLALGWLGWLSLATVWLLVIAVVRIKTHETSTALGALQLPPSVALVIALALLLEAAGAGSGPPAGDNATGVAVASALLSVLYSVAPRNLDVELVLQGAGEGHEIGIRKYLRARTGSPGQTIVLGIAPCAAGQVRWWRSDGRLIPLGYSRRVRELAEAVAHDRAVGHDRARAHRGRGGTPALPARAKIRPLPAITIGTLDARGLPRGTPANARDVPRGTLADARSLPRATPAQLDPANLNDAVEFGLLLIEAIDAELDGDRTAAASAPTPA